MASNELLDFTNLADSMGTYLLHNGLLALSKFQEGRSGSAFTRVLP